MRFGSLICVLAIAYRDADSIMSYMRESIKKTGIDKHIQYEHKLVSMNWNSQDALWELNLKVGKAGESKVVRASWVVLGTGYYDYEKALPTTIPGLDNFKGKVSLPQSCCLHFLTLVLDRTPPILA